MAWLTGWSYRKQITISGSTGAGTNYQVLLKVGESSGSSGYNFHINGHSASFPSGKNNSGDLRFTASDGDTLLDFWVENVTGSSPNRLAYIWVEVSADLGSNQNIYCYYGNSSATNVSNGGNTFLLFDDFDGSSLDTNKWSCAYGVYSISNSIITLGSSSQNGKIISINTYSTGYATRAYSKLGTLNSPNGGTYLCSFGVSDWYPRQQIETQNSSYYGLKNINSSQQETTVWSSVSKDTNYHTFEVRRGSSSSVGLIDTTTITNSSYYVTGNLYCCLASEATNNVPILVDWVLVRKYISTEPAFSSAGSEELLVNYGVLRRRLLLR